MKECISLLPLLIFWKVIYLGYESTWTTLALCEGGGAVLEVVYCSAGANRLIYIGHESASLTLALEGSANMFIKCSTSEFGFFYKTLCRTVAETIKILFLFKALIEGDRLAMVVLRIILLAFLLFVHSNSESQTKRVTDKHIVKKKYNDKKILIYEQQFLKTDKGLIPDGYYKGYYDNGKLERYGKCKDGRLDSIETSYYENGVVKQTHTFFMNFFIGGQYGYNEDGKLDWYVHCFSPQVPDSFVIDKATTFSIGFSKNGKLIGYSGKPLHIFGVEPFYKPSDTAFIFCDFLPPIPGTVMKLMTYVAQKNKKTVVNTYTNSDKKDLFGMYFKKFSHLCVTGPAKWQIVYLLHDKQSGKLLVTDTLVATINVKN